MQQRRLKLFRHKLHAWAASSTSICRLPSSRIYATQEVDHASPGLARSSAVSYRSTLVSTHHCDGQQIVPRGSGRLCSLRAPPDDDDDDTNAYSCQSQTTTALRISRVLWLLRCIICQKIVKLHNQLSFSLHIHCVLLYLPYPYWIKIYVHIINIIYLIRQVAAYSKIINKHKSQKKTEILCTQWINVTEPTLPCTIVIYCTLQRWKRVWRT